MIALLITILIQIGVITRSNEYYELSEQQQTHYQETIIIEDIMEM